jgi:biotin carboxylase
MNNKQKTIMILGAGTMQIPALTTARKKGWRVIAMDGNPRAPGIPIADIFEPIDLREQETLLARARFYKETSGLDGIFTAGTDFSVSVAFIAQNLGLPGIPIQVAQNATNKARMRQLFATHHIPSPAFISCTASEFDKLSTFNGSFPVVVKPVDNMGARGVQMVTDPSRLQAACEKALTFSRTGAIIVEELINGPEFSVDALVYQGQIHAFGIADRHIYFPPFFVELGHTFPSSAPKEILENVEEVFRRGIQALGIDNGAAKGDIFHTSRGAVVGEIAARLSGGYMSGWTCPYACGLDITEAAMNIALGLPPGDLGPRKAWTSAERAFISIPGETAGVLGLNQALEVPGIQDIFTRAEPGSPLKFPENNVEKCGNVISALPKRKDAIAVAHKAVSLITVRLKPSNKETAAFLFASPAAPWPPPAFPIPENLRQRITSMPPLLSPASGKTLSLGPFRATALDYKEAARLKDWNHRGIAATLSALTKILKKTAPPPGHAASSSAGSSGKPSPAADSRAPSGSSTLSNRKKQPKIYKRE